MGSVDESRNGPGPGRRRRVLLLNQYFPPDTSATAKMAAEVARALSERFDVTVLAGRPSYDPAESHGYYLWRITRSGSLTVERVGSSSCDRRNLFGRVWNYVTYALLATPRAIAARADVILGMTDPPFAGIMAAVAARVRRRPFVYNIRDLHPDMAVVSGMMRPGRTAHLWDTVHRWALRSADKVVVLGEDMRQRILDKGVAAARIEIVRDGVSVADEPPAPLPAVSAEVRGGFSFVAVHAGNLGSYGAWDTLVAAMALVRSPGTGLVFVGGGTASDQVHDIARGSDRIRFLPFYPAHHVPQMLAAAEVHIVSIRRGIEGLVVPSKLYPILAAGRPVLAVAADDSDVALVVRRHDCGVVADPDSPEEVAAALDGLAADQGRLLQMGKNAQRLAREFDSRVQLERFVNLLDEI